MIEIKPMPLRSEGVRVSAAITCYNYGHYLGACVNAILEQEGVEVDVVIVDDGSKDDSLDVARRLEKADPRVRVVAHESNQGPIATVNEALSLARSDYVLKMDADDILAPGSLQRSVALMETFPQVSLVYGGVKTFEHEPPTDSPSEVRSWTVWSGGEWLRRRYRSGHNVIRQPEALVRRSALDIVGGHREQLPASSDFAMWLRLASVGSVGRLNGPVQGYYRIHSGSLQRTVHSGILFDLTERINAMELFFEECWDRLDEPEASRQLARHTLARDALHLAQRSIDLGSHDVDPIDDYLAIAERLDPGIVKSARWRAVQARLRLVQRGLPALARLTIGNAYREVERRVAWHWEQRFGL